MSPSGDGHRHLPCACVPGAPCLVPGLAGLTANKQLTYFKFSLLLLLLLVLVVGYITIYISNEYTYHIYDNIFL